MYLSRGGHGSWVARGQLATGCEEPGGEGTPCCVWTGGSVTKDFILGWVRQRQCCHPQRVPGGRQERNSHINQEVTRPGPHVTCTVTWNPLETARGSSAGGNDGGSAHGRQHQDPRPTLSTGLEAPFPSFFAVTSPPVPQRPCHQRVSCLPETLPTTKMAQTNPMPGSVGPWKVSSPPSGRIVSSPPRQGMRGAVSRS